MKLPIQAQPVSRKVSSAMLAKKAANAIGASSACDGKEAECSWTFAGCGVAFAAGGPGAAAACLASIGAADCFGCLMERMTSGGPDSARRGHFDGIM